jgi:hypothetical protein
MTLHGFDITISLPVTRHQIQIGLDGAVLIHETRTFPQLAGKVIPEADALLLRKAH